MERDTGVLIGAALVVGAIVAIASFGDWRNQPALSTSRAQVPAVPVPVCARPPVNGAVLIFDLTVADPQLAHVLEFRNDTSGNAIVKIKNAGSGALVVSFFVAAKMRASFEYLPDGAYKIQYALGRDLAQDCHSFVHAYDTEQVPGIKTVTEEHRADGVIVSQLTYTVFAEPSATANTRPSPISQADFDAD